MVVYLILENGIGPGNIIVCRKIMIDHQIGGSLLSDKPISGDHHWVGYAEVSIFQLRSVRGIVKHRLATKRTPLRPSGKHPLDALDAFKF